MTPTLRQSRGRRRWDDAKAYRFPDDGFYRTLNFSGGRSSAYLLWQVLSAYEGVLPDNVTVVFCNTGKEREQTLAFVQQCQDRWQVPINWLEFELRPHAKGGRKDPKRSLRVVNYETASRNGEPFHDLNTSRRMLPNVVTRSCTAELKVSTTERFVRWHLGWPKKKVKNVIGFRYDEPNRWQEGLVARCNIEFPMVHARVTKRDVLAFWARQPFDLGIHSARGNCDLCFLKGANNLIATIRDDPQLADWWIAEERRAKSLRVLRNESVAQFSRRWSYEELKHHAESSPELPLRLVDDGPGFSCFCTD